MPSVEEIFHIIGDGFGDVFPQPSFAYSVEDANEGDLSAIYPFGDLEHGVTAEAVPNEDDWLGRNFFVDILDDLLHLFNKFFIIGWRRSDFPSSILQRNAGIALLIDLVPVRDVDVGAILAQELLKLFAWDTAACEAVDEKHKSRVIVGIVDGGIQGLICRSRK